MDLISTFTDSVDLEASCTVTAAVPTTRAETPEWERWNVVHKLSKQIQASYQAGRVHKGLWEMARFQDADAAMRPEVRRNLRKHSRYEAANNPQVDRVNTVWVNDLVGPGGPLLNLNCGIAELNAFVEKKWSKWWRKTNQASKLSTMVRAETVDGEALGIRSNAMSNVLKSGIGTQPIPLEIDRLQSPDWENSNRSNYVDGVYINPETHEPIAYDILKAHPGSEYIDTVHEKFEATPKGAHEVFHVFREIRAEQHRGIPRCTPALMLSGLVRKFLLAKVDKAQMQSAISWLLKSQLPPEDGKGDPNDADAFLEFAMPTSRGIVGIVPDGYEPIPSRTDGDSDDLEEFNRIVAMLYAGCYCMPLGRAQGDTKGSYAPVRADMLPYQNALDFERCQVWEPKYMDPLYADFIAELSLTPEFRATLEAIRKQYEDEGKPWPMIDLMDTTWQWADHVAVVDPSRDAEADRKDLSMGKRTRSQVARVTDIDEHDRRGAVELGFVNEKGEPDLVKYRQKIAQALGMPEDQQEESGEESTDDKAEKQSSKK